MCIRDRDYPCPLVILSSNTHYDDSLLYSALAAFPPDEDGQEAKFNIGLTCAIRNLGKSAWAVCDYSTSLAKVLIDRFPHVDGEELLFTEPADAMEELLSLIHI